MDKKEEYKNILSDKKKEELEYTKSEYEFKPAQENLEKSQKSS